MEYYSNQIEPSDRRIFASAGDRDKIGAAACVSCDQHAERTGGASGKDDGGRKEQCPLLRAVLYFDGSGTLSDL